MSTVLRRNRKGTDSQITRHNAVGYSLATIGEKLGCHPTSVTLRLKSLNIPPADTRRSFMEGILNTLPESQVELLADILTADGTPRSVQDYVRELIVNDLATRTPVLSSQSDTQTAP